MKRAFILRDYLKFGLSVSGLLCDIQYRLKHYPSDTSSTVFFVQSDRNTASVPIAHRGTYAHKRDVSYMPAVLKSQQKKFSFCFFFSSYDLFFLIKA